MPMVFSLAIGLVSSVTLSVFQLYLQHHTYFWNVYSVTCDASIVIWNASSAKTIHVSVKRENWNVLGVV
jgi:hypothetical protein